MFLVLHLETMLTGRVQYPPVTSTVSVTGSGIVHALLYTFFTITEKAFSWLKAPTTTFTLCSSLTHMWLLLVVNKLLQKC